MLQVSSLLRRAAPLLVLALLPRPALADADDEARRRLEEGSLLFQQGQLLRARTAFAAAHDLAPERANPYRWLGLVDAQLGRCEDALHSLAEFEKRVPSTDPRLAEIRQVRERCRGELEEQATLWLESSPTGAQASLGDPPELLGSTPVANHRLKPGSYQLTLEKPGYVALKTNLSARPKEHIRLSLQLAPAAGAVPAVAPHAAAGAVPAVAPYPVATRSVAPRPAYRRWWFWTALAGGVVAATAVGLGVGLSSSASGPAPIHVK